MCEFDDQTTLGCLEVFKACLTLLFSPNYSLNMDAFLSAISEYRVGSRCARNNNTRSLVARIYYKLALQMNCPHTYVLFICFMPLINNTN